jgi:hypothetical protein
VAVDPEARAQLARLLHDESLRDALPDAIRSTVDAGFDQLITGILAEATSSDDVIDADSARAFLEARVDFLGALLNDEQRSRLLQALHERIDAW